jgi:hypothetical protein
MNLSLYLLLAPPSENEQGLETRAIPGAPTKPAYVPVYDPLHGRLLRKKRRIQAIRKTRLVPARNGVAAQSSTQPPVQATVQATVQAIGVGLSMIVNAAGFLAITAGVLMLLRIAEISLA